MRPGRSSASSSASGRFVAIMTRMRYFGGGLGRMPSMRRTYRLTNPRGFLSPDSSVSRACSVPMPPPPMPMPPITNRLRRSRGAVLDPAAGPVFPRELVLRLVGQVAEPVAAVDWNGVIATAGSPGPPWASMPRLPSESASSKKTITPP